MMFTVNFLECAINSTTIKLFYAVQFFFSVFVYSYFLEFKYRNDVSKSTKLKRALLNCKEKEVAFAGLDNYNHSLICIKVIEIFS